MKTRKPANLAPLETIRLRATLETEPRLDAARPLYYIAKQCGWKAFVTACAHGLCSYKLRQITIPLWAEERSYDYYLYYICHELAHIPNPGIQHGPDFMKTFRSICPPELQHYELDYKPRLAKAAGIRKPLEPCEPCEPDPEFPL